MQVQMHLGGSLRGSCNINAKSICELSPFDQECLKAWVAARNPAGACYQFPCPNGHIHVCLPQGPTGPVQVIIPERVDYYADDWNRGSSGGWHPTWGRRSGVRRRRR